MNITYEDFSKLDIRVATIKAAEAVEGADKLLKITLDAGELGERTVAAGIKAWYAPDDLVGKQVLYLANLEPRMLRGIESQGMILAADESNSEDGQTSRAVLVHPGQVVDPGSKIR